MKKLKLDLDALKVDTFDPAAPEDADGTVFGEQVVGTAWTCANTCLTCRPTCRASCPATCFNTCPASCVLTCGHPTCANTCLPTCPATCQFTCFPTCGTTCIGWTCVAALCRVSGLVIC